MDELELLKKDWKKQEDTLPEFSYNQLYKMHLKKSSSIVRWIFIISVLEFVLWTSLDIIWKITNGYDSFSEMGPIFSISTSVISYGVLIYFVIRFYLSYRQIQITDSSKVLMKNILNTRKTVRQYVLANVLFFTVLCTIMILLIIFNKIPVSGVESNHRVLFGVISFVVMLVFIAFIFGFYRVIYGILTRKLQKNYDELERAEV